MNEVLTEDEEDFITGLTWRYNTRHTDYGDIPGIDAVIHAVRVYRDEHKQLLAIIEKLKKALEAKA